MKNFKRSINIYIVTLTILHAYLSLLIIILILGSIEDLELQSKKTRTRAGKYNHINNVVKKEIVVKQSEANSKKNMVST